MGACASKPKTLDNEKPTPIEAPEEVETSKAAQENKVKGGEETKETESSIEQHSQPTEEAKECSTSKPDESPVEEKALETNIDEEKAPEAAKIQDDKVVEIKAEEKTVVFKTDSQPDEERVAKAKSDEEENDSKGTPDQEGDKQALETNVEEKISKMQQVETKAEAEDKVAEAKAEVEEEGIVETKAEVEEEKLATETTETTKDEEQVVESKKNEKKPETKNEEDKTEANNIKLDNMSTDPIEESGVSKPEKAVKLIEEEAKPAEGQNLQDKTDAPLVIM